MNLNQALRENVRLTNKLVKLEKLKEDLRTAKALQKHWALCLKHAEAHAKVRIEQLQGELDEVKEDALDQLQDRAEVVGELQKRAVPEGWEAISLRKDSWKRTIARLSVCDEPVWRWSVMTISGRKWGDCETLVEAVKAAEAVKLQKVKLTAKRVKK